MLLRFKVGKCLLQSCLGTACLRPCSNINMAQFFLNQKRPNLQRNSDSITPPFPILRQSKMSPNMVRCFQGQGEKGCKITLIENHWSSLVALWPECASESCERCWNTDSWAALPEFWFSTYGVVPRIYPYSRFPGYVDAILTTLFWEPLVFRVKTVKDRT